MTLREVAEWIDVWLRASAGCEPISAGELLSEIATPIREASAALRAAEERITTLTHEQQKWHQREQVLLERCQLETKDRLQAEERIRHLEGGAKQAYDALPDVEVAKKLLLDAVCPLDVVTHDDVAWAKALLSAREVT